MNKGFCLLLNILQKLSLFLLFYLLLCNLCLAELITIPLKLHSKQPSSLVKSDFDCPFAELRDVPVADSTNTMIFVWFDNYYATAGSTLARTFMEFDVHLPDTAKIKNGYLSLYVDYFGTPQGKTPVEHYELMMMEGTEHNPLVLEDFQAFTGPSFGYSVVPFRKVFKIYFNDTGIEYLQKKLNGKVKLCLRENYYDYSGHPMPGDDLHGYMAIAPPNTRFSARRPRLVIEYSLPEESE